MRYFLVSMVSGILALSSTVVQALPAVAASPGSGGSVLVYAWPGQSVLRSESVGSRVPFRLIARTSPGAVIQLSAPLAPSSQIMAVYSSEGLLRNFSITRVGETHLRIPTAPTRTVFAHVASSQTSEHDSGLLGPIPQVGGCYTYFDKNLGSQLAIVAGAWSGTNGGDVHAYYTEGASSSLGVGDSPSGAYGSFNATGTNLTTSSGTAGFPDEYFSYGSHRFQTDFLTYEYQIVCDPGSGPAVTYQIQSVGWASGTAVQSVGTISSSYCATFAGGSTFTKDTTQQWTWSTGFSIPVVGASLSAQTGFSTSDKLEFSFNVQRALCGTNAFPGQTPRRLQVLL